MIVLHIMPQFCVDPRLYHYRWSWVLPGLFWLSDATNDVQFYWAVRLQRWRVCWSGRCCRVSTHPVWLDLLVKCNSCRISSFNVLMDRKSSVNLSFCIKTLILNSIQKAITMTRNYIKIYSQYYANYKSIKYWVIRW